MWGRLRLWTAPALGASKQGTPTTRRHWHNLLRVSDAADILRITQGQ